MRFGSSNTGHILNYKNIRYLEIKDIKIADEAIGDLFVLFSTIVLDSKECLVILGLQLFIFGVSDVVIQVLKLLNLGISRPLTFSNDHKYPKNITTSRA